VWVGQIPAAILDMDPNDVLTKLFERYGTIASITLRPKPGTGKSWAFVTYSTEAEATSALSNSSGFEHEGVALEVRSSAVSEHLELNRQKGTQGALAMVWQHQMEKEATWMGSLLDGLNSDVHYQNAKAIIARSLGLRAEELEDELEDQELEELLLASWDDQQLSSQDYETEEGAEDAFDDIGLAAPPTGGTALGLPPSMSAPRPSVGFEPEPEPEPAQANAEGGVSLTQLSRGVSKDFMITSQGVSCDV
jgi:hypothetical protein